MNYNYASRSNKGVGHFYHYVRLAPKEWVSSTSKDAANGAVFFNEKVVVPISEASKYPQASGWYAVGFYIADKNKHGEDMWVLAQDPNSIRPRSKTLQVGTHIGLMGKGGNFVPFIPGTTDFDYVAIDRHIKFQWLDELAVKVGFKSKARQHVNHGVTRSSGNSNVTMKPAIPKVSHDELIATRVRFETLTSVAASLGVITPEIERQISESEKALRSMGDDKYVDSVYARLNASAEEVDQVSPEPPMMVEVTPIVVESTIAVDSTPVEVTPIVVEAPPVTVRVLGPDSPSKDNVEKMLAEEAIKASMVAVRAVIESQWQEDTIPDPALSLIHI